MLGIDKLKSQVNVFYEEFKWHPRPLVSLHTNPNLTFKPLNSEILKVFRPITNSLSHHFFFLIQSK